MAGCQDTKLRGQSRLSAGIEDRVIAAHYQLSAEKSRVEQHEDSFAFTVGREG